jgi:Xaa-Pro aminopeptidase
MDRSPKLLNEPRLRAMMAERGIDLLILRGPENSKYMTDFFNNGGTLGYRPFCVFYFADPARAHALVVPAVDLHLAMTQTWIGDVRAYAMAEFFTDIDTHFYPDFFAAAQAILAERKVTGLVIGTEGEQLTAGYRARLEALLDGNTIVDVAQDMDIVRMVKTPEEIARLRRATDITLKAHESFRAAIRPGATDEDLSKAALIRMMQEGAHGISFINIGCTPDTSFAAHAPWPNGHVLARGDFVKVDMGASWKGYPADFVRSYFVGETTQRHRDIWKWLNDVQIETGLGLKAGKTGGEIFDAAYARISRHLNNFPREFIGHGLGLNAHEQPRMNQVNRTVLEPNTVVCLEFSYYHDGCRHHTEDTFLVTETGVEWWTEPCGRDLVVT